MTSPGTRTSTHAGTDGISSQSTFRKSLLYSAGIHAQRAKEIEEALRTNGGDSTAFFEELGLMFAHLDTLDDLGIDETFVDPQTLADTAQRFTTHIRDAWVDSGVQQHDLFLERLLEAIQGIADHYSLPDDELMSFFSKRGRVTNLQGLLGELEPQRPPARNDFDAQFISALPATISQLRFSTDELLAQMGRMYARGEMEPANDPNFRTILDRVALDMTELGFMTTDLRVPQPDDNTPLSQSVWNLRESILVQIAQGHTRGPAFIELYKDIEGLRTALISLESMAPSNNTDFNDYVNEVRNVVGHTYAPFDERVRQFRQTPSMYVDPVSGPTQSPPPSLADLRQKFEDLGVPAAPPIPQYTPPTTNAPAPPSSQNPFNVPPYPQPPQLVAPPGTPGVNDNVSRWIRKRNRRAFRIAAAVVAGVGIAGATLVTGGFALGVLALSGGMASGIASVPALKQWWTRKRLEGQTAKAKRQADRAEALLTKSELRALDAEGKQRAALHNYTEAQTKRVQFEGELSDALSRKAVALQKRRKWLDVLTDPQLKEALNANYVTDYQVAIAQQNLDAGYHEIQVYDQKISNLENALEAARQREQELFAEVAPAGRPKFDRANATFNKAQAAYQKALEIRGRVMQLEGRTAGDPKLDDLTKDAVGAVHRDMDVLAGRFNNIIRTGRPGAVAPMPDPGLAPQTTAAQSATQAASPTPTMTPPTNPGPGGPPSPTPPTSGGPTPGPGGQPAPTGTGDFAAYQQRRAKQRQPTTIGTGGRVAS